MCGICGCTDEAKLHLDHNHDHHHDHDHSHKDHVIPIEQDIFTQNNHFAKQNEAYFHENQILALNIMSSPGAGKTTLLSRTFAELKNLSAAVIVGDQQTDYDAKMLKAHGALAFQINTGRVCHLDAHMVSHAIQDIPLAKKMTLFIENIGNLVCPALFNLGEKHKIVILSVAEGDNKPLKYPDMFRFSDLMIITKMDLLPFVDFDLERCVQYAKQINPKIKILRVSAKQGEGLTEWYQWLEECH